MVITVRNQLRIYTFTCRKLPQQYYKLMQLVLSSLTISFAVVFETSQLCSSRSRDGCICFEQPARLTEPPDRLSISCTLVIDLLTSGYGQRQEIDAKLGGNEATVLLHSIPPQMVMTLLQLLMTITRVINLTSQCPELLMHAKVSEVTIRPGNLSY